MAKNNINNNKSIVSGLQGLSEAEARRLLQNEGKKLEKIARSVWRAYLASYSPKQYVRTGKAERAIKLGRVKRINALELGIELTWENDLVYHDSVISSAHPQGHAVMLISSGWQVSGSHRDVYRFGYYEGFDYLGKVEKTYNAMKDAQVQLEIQWSGKALRGR